MTPEQEIRAKALETAALILGPHRELEPYRPKQNHYGGLDDGKDLIDYDGTMAHYLELAGLIEQYIAAAGEK